MSSTAEILKRVKELAEHYASVNSAAKAWRVPQRTLARLVAGGIAQPRVDLLTKVAAGAGVRLEWLITGIGDREDPQYMPGVSSDEKLLAVLKEIGLSEDAQRHYTQAAWTIAVAARVLLVLPNRNSPPENPGFVITAWEPVGSVALEKIVDQQVGAWIRLIQDLTQAVGKDEARRRLETIAPFAHRFHGSYADEWYRCGLDITEESGIAYGSP